MEADAVHAQLRFGFGAGPGGAVQGDPRIWLKAQIEGPDPGLASGVFAELPTGQAALDVQREDAILRKQQLQAKAAGLPQPSSPFKSMSHQLYVDDAVAQLNFAAFTPAPFRERLVWFWANHFSVSILQGNTAALVGPFIREAIRPNVTGHFADLVLAVERHPAMLCYLDNQQSVGPGSPAGLKSHKGLDENLGRECMELHTVGLEAGYSQGDVTNMAKLLTGWSVATTQEGGGDDMTGFKFRQKAHEPGPQTIMGHECPDGEAGGIAALRFLATYPTAYRRVATQLATHFIGDTPPPGAVEALYQTLSRSEGHLGTAYAQLIELGMAAPPLAKLKTPFDYAVSLLRAAPPQTAPKPEATLNMLAQLGQPVWSAPLPNGWPDTAANWADPDLVLGRVDAAYTYAGFAGGADPQMIATGALGPMRSQAMIQAMQQAGSPREALALLFSSPEFQRR